MKSSRLDCHCMLAASPQTWFFVNAGKTKQVSSARLAVTGKSKTSEVSRKVKYTETLYQREILSTSHIARIKRTMLGT